MAEFSIYDFEGNPNLPYFKPRQLRFRRVEKLTGVHEPTTHVETVPPPHVQHAPAEHSTPPDRPPPHHVDHTTPPHEGGHIDDRPPPKDNETVHEDGSKDVKGADGTVKTHEAGDRENPLSNKTQKEVKDKESTDENNAREKEKKSIIDKITKGLMLLPLLLPLALLLAAVAQGEADCQDINGSAGAPPLVSSTPPKVMTVTKVYSAAWPSWAPDWAQTGKTKYDIAYTPCIKILANDQITFTDTTNTFPTGQQSIDSSPQSCVVRIDFGTTLTIDPNVANVATFTDKTDCSDRMAYAAGQDAGLIAQTAGSGLSSLLSGLFGGINLSSIFLVICAVIALYFAFQFAMSALKK
jgi:hypothetical protein